MNESAEKPEKSPKIPPTYEMKSTSLKCRFVMYLKYSLLLNFKNNCDLICSERSLNVKFEEIYENY